MTNNEPHLFRLRAELGYSATLYARVASSDDDDGAAASRAAPVADAVRFTAPSFACGELFDGTAAYGNVSGTQRPSWGVLFVDATVCAPTWSGLVALDEVREGRAARRARRGPRPLRTPFGTSFERPLGRPLDVLLWHNIVCGRPSLSPSL